jgi:hypothetical protein
MKLSTRQSYNIYFVISLVIKINYESVKEFLLLLLLFVIM